MIRFLLFLLLATFTSAQEIRIDKTYVSTTKDKLKNFVRDDVREVVIDRTRVLEWQDDKSVGTVKRDWHGAIDYCEALSFAGHSDWRLPTMDELLTITDKSRRDPALHEAFRARSSEWFWSASPVVDDASRAWGVVFKRGYSDGVRRTSTYAVHCVRLGSR